MFEYYVMTLVIIISIYLIYHKYFISDFIKAEWLQINKDINFKNNLNWDISSNSVVKVANFSRWNGFFHGRDLFTKIKEKEAVMMIFKNDEDSECVLDVLDENMKSVHRIFDPESIVFSCTEKEFHYYLEKDKKYIFFLRNNFLDQQVKSEIRKYRDVEKIKGKLSKCEGEICYVNEENIHEEYISKCNQIMEAMKKRNYRLVNISKSEQYLSYPANNIGNKVSVKVKLNEVLILMCSNKEKTCGALNHNIEINSKNNNLNWYPDDNETISHLLLDNSDQSDIFTFYERLINVSNGSHVLPFHVLIFTKNEF